MNGKNVLHRTPIVSALLMGSCILLHLFSNCGQKMVLEEDTVVTDQVESQTNSVKPEPTLSDEKNSIVDYGGSMAHFFRALRRIEKGSKKGQYVRIAYFGDSFIEADILTADLRERLQQQYGGSGVGFVPITSKTSGYRTTVIHKYRNWHSHSFTDKNFDVLKQGISGHYFVPQKDAYIKIKGTKTYIPRLENFQKASIFFTDTEEKVTIDAVMNQVDSLHEKHTFSPKNRLQKMTVEGDLRTVQWSVDASPSALFYGVTVDGTRGVVLDNFSLRSTNGTNLSTIPLETLQQFNKYRPYDLIILQYGLNVVEKNKTNYDLYIERMKKSIHHLKKAFPQASILLISVSDREQKDKQGYFRTMPGVENLVHSQQQLAKDESIAFWNCFEAMGREGSMARMVQSQPPLANKDYTHINFKGGKYLADIFYEAIESGKRKYK